MSLALHNLIQNYNVLSQPTTQIGNYLRKHPNIYKVVLLVNHVFRTVSMTALSLLLPFSMSIRTAICFTGSLFYRLTVETHCAYKFALPTFAGSIAFLIGQTAFVGLISDVAFISLRTLAITFASLLPLTAYCAYVVLTVSYDVDTSTRYL